LFIVLWRFNMSDTSQNPPKTAPTFAETIGTKVARKLEARRNPSPGVWFGLGMMGLVGWSVAVPALLGAALGRWLDKHYADGHSWTLMLLLGGLILGCLNAWHWVSREDQAIHGEVEDDDA
jgi:ATP synthase protein I